MSIDRVELMKFFFSQFPLTLHSQNFSSNIDKNKCLIVMCTFARFHSISSQECQFPLLIILEDSIYRSDKENYHFEGA